MKVHIICPVFPPESVASAVMVQQIAAALVRERNDVSVITSFPSKMKGTIFPGYRRKLVEIKVPEQGYRLCRVFTFFSRKSSIISRMPENLSFALASNLTSLFLEKPDVVFMDTWPVFSSFITALLCKLRRVPFVYDVQDMYPESATGLGLLKEESVLYKLLLRFDRWTMSMASKIVPNSEEFAAVIRESRKVPVSKIVPIWNWYDNRVAPEEKWGSYRNSIAPEKDSCVVMYAGNIGSVAGLEVVLQAADILEHRGRYTFVLAGDGTEREKLERQCTERGIKNIKFYFPLHRDDLGTIQAAADIMLITTKRDLSLSEVPSKMMAYMLSGRPILAMVNEESNTARLVRLADCGLVGPPDDAQALSDLVTEMHRSGQLDTWGRNARKFAEEHFDQDRSVSKIIAVLASVAK